jgi:hypothetical protein
MQGSRLSIGNALAGLHARYVMWLLDESGAYPDAIMPVCEAIFAGDPTEAHIVQAGNPTHLSGPLYAACTKARRFWQVIEITADPDDPKRTTRVSVEHARQQIATYGRDNPWVKVRVFGEFPPASLNALIGPDEVSAAMRGYYQPSEIGSAAKIIVASTSPASATTRARLHSGKGSKPFRSRLIATSTRPMEWGLSRGPWMSLARTPSSSTIRVASGPAGSTGCGGSADRRSASASRRSPTIAGISTSARRWRLSACNGSGAAEQGAIIGHVPGE